MNREEFCSKLWSYYLMLEKDFLETERYVNFDLGKNNLYNNTNPINIGDYGNSLAYSNEYVKQYLSICSEIDAVMKTICVELGNTTAKK